MFRLVQASVKVSSIHLLNSPAKVTSRLIASATKIASVPESADVVIIGGGSIGCHTLYQLSRRGVKAILLERAKVTSGTTWHTSGIIWSLRPNDVDVQLLTATKDVFMRLESETGMNPGWINNGAVYIAQTELRLDELRRLANLSHSMGVESHIIDPAEAQKLFPLLNPTNFIGSLYSPRDGVVDPAMLCAALTKASTNAGAKVIEDCPVTQIQTGENVFGTKQVTGVVTPHGTIKTNCVVNCAGVWGREVAGLVGLQLPLQPSKHAYIVTQSVPGVRGLPNIRAPDSALYMRIQGESLCLGGYETNPIFIDKVSEDMKFSLYELDWNLFNNHMEAAVDLVPAFETAGIKSTVCGAESFTPDHKPIMGEDPRLFGLYHGCAFNSVGMMLGGGCGEQLAKWIIHGRPDLPMFSYDIRRFTEEQRNNKKWVNDRNHEAYATNFNLYFSHDEPLAGRNLIQDPFHQELVNAGAFMEEVHGWERPGWYLKEGTAPVPEYDWYGAYGKPLNTDRRYIDLLAGEFSFNFSKHHDIFREEALSCREEVALFNTSYFGKMFLSGPDAQLAADWLFTADTRLPIGKSVYSCLLNDRAGVEGDVTISAVEGSQDEPFFKGQGFYVVSNGAPASHICGHIQSVIAKKGFKAELTDLDDKIGVLSIQGPNSRALLQQISDVDLSDEQFPFSTTQLIRVGGHRCRALRISFVGELGWELHVPWDSCVPVLKAVMEEGKKHGLRLGGYRALYSLGSEKGRHLWHSDLRSNDNPIEAGLGFTCRDSGDYLGKDALENAKMDRPQKRLVFFQLKEHIPLWGLETIYKDGKAVGFIRVGEYSFTLGTTIGRGYVTNPGGNGVSIAYLKSGSYEIEVMGKVYPASLHLRSPFDPENKRMMGSYEEKIPIRQ